MSTADAEHFEARFRADPDPWRYEASSYERAKYARTLEACGPGPFARALELGAAGGVFSAELAQRCDELVTVDFSPTAVGLARERLTGAAHVTVLRGTIPDDLPPGDFDLVVASEVLYYLPDDDFRRTVDRLPRILRAGGRLVAVHWTGQAPDLRRSAAETHRALRTGSGLRPVPAPAGPEPARGYLLDAFEMR